MALEGVVGVVGDVFHSVFPYLVWAILIGAAVYYFFVIKARLGY